MKAFLAFVILMIFSLHLQAQRVLVGKVFLYNDNSANTPVGNVYIKADFGGASVTGSDGIYKLSFDNNADKVALKIRKDGFEVINAEEVNQVDLTKKSQQNIYLDHDGNMLKRSRELQDAALAILRKKRDQYLLLIDKGGAASDKLRNRLEHETGIEFKDNDDLKTWVADKFGVDSKTLEGLVQSIMKTNLDHSNSAFEKIKKYVLTGQVDSAIRLLNLKEDYQQAENNIKEMELRQKANKILKEKYLLASTLYLTKGFYQKVDSAYRLIILLDPSDGKSFFKYGEYLNDQNMFTSAASYIEKGLAGTGEIDLQAKTRAYIALGIAYRRLEMFKKADAAYDNALTYAQKLLAKGDSLGKEDLAIIYGNKGNMARDSGSVEVSEKYYQKAVDIYHALSDSKKLNVDEELVTLYFNLIDLYQEADSTHMTVRTLRQAGHLIRTLVKDNPGIYDRQFANLLHYEAELDDSLNVLQRETKLKLAISMLTSLKPAYTGDYERLIHFHQTLGQLYESNERLGEARDELGKALGYAEILSKKNPQRYDSLLAESLEDLAEVLSDVGFNTQAENYYSKATQVYKRLLPVDSRRFQVKLAKNLQSLGCIQLYGKKYELAKTSLAKSLLIWIDLEKMFKGKYELQIAKSMNDLSLAFRGLDDTTEQKRYLFYANSIFRAYAKKDSSSVDNLLAKNLTYVADYYDDRGKTKEAIKAYFEALTVFKKLLMNDEIAKIYINLSVLYGRRKDNDRSLEYMEKARPILDSLAKIDPLQRVAQATCYMGLGLIYVQKKDFSNAKLNFIIAKKILLVLYESDRKSWVKDFTGNNLILAWACFKTNGETEARRNLTEAVNIANNILKEPSNDVLACSMILKSAEVYRRANKLADAIMLYQRAISVAKDFKTTLRTTYKIVYTSYARYCLTSLSNPTSGDFFDNGLKKLMDTMPPREKSTLKSLLDAFEELQ